MGTLFHYDPYILWKYRLCSIFWFLCHGGKVCPKKYGAMLKKSELAQNITKRTKVKKECKTQSLNHGTHARQIDVLAITTRKPIKRNSQLKCYVSPSPWISTLWIDLFFNKCIAKCSLDTVNCMQMKSTFSQFFYKHFS